MTKKEKLILQLRKQTFLPLYIRNAKIDILNNDADVYFDVLSNNYSYQTKKHNHNTLYKPIIILDEKI